MKHYTDYDPLHGHGKAIPKPKRPNPTTYRGYHPGTSRRITPGQVGQCCRTNTCRQVRSRMRRTTFA